MTPLPWHHTYNPPVCPHPAQLQVAGIVWLTQQLLQTTKTHFPGCALHAAYTHLCLFNDNGTAIALLLQKWVTWALSHYV